MRIMRRVHVTAVACVVFTTMAASGQGGPVHYRGLQQAPLGAATIGLDANDQLIVANIGSSGLDGVRAELGAAGGWLAAVDIGPAGNAVPAGRRRPGGAGSRPGPEWHPVVVVIVASPSPRSVP